MFRAVYPIGIHFFITQIVALFVMGMYLMLGKKDLMSSALLTTGMASIVLLPLTGFLMKLDDRMRRYPGKIWHIGVVDAALAFILGICYGQIGNTVIGLLNLFEWFGGYSRMMDQLMEGQSFFTMVLWVGLAAPAAEEMIFRGLVYRRLKDYIHPKTAMILSSLAFGIYHGNVVQFLYATFMGIIFALLLERTRSLWGCILAHMGANLWSVVMTCFGTELLELGNGMVIGAVLLALLAGGILGIFYLKSGKSGR